VCENFPNWEKNSSEKIIQRKKIFFLNPTAPFAPVDFWDSHPYPEPSGRSLSVGVSGQCCELAEALGGHGAATDA
jgi:hypothetical protein